MKEWRIDTGMKGEVLVSDLRATLEASRKHLLDTQEKAAGLPAHAAAGAGPSGKEDPQGAIDHMKKVEEMAAPLRAKHAAAAAELADSMEMGIDHACAMAEHFQAKQPSKKLLVTATVQGHFDPRHPSGSGARMSVSVDQTWAE